MTMARDLRPTASLPALLVTAALALLLAPLAAPAQTAAPAAAPDDWLDEGHQAVSRGLLWPVARLDRFFSDEREVDLPRARSFVRWRNDLKLYDDGAFAYTTDVRAELRFPGLDRRLDRLGLVISGGTTDALDRLLPGDASASDPTGRGSAGLRLDVLDSLFTQTDLRVGLLFGLPVGWFTRLRFRHVQPLGEVLVARLALSGFWQTNTGWGTRQDLDLERPLWPWLLLRLANTATISEVTRGWEWTSELSLLATVGERGAVGLAGAAMGASRPGQVPGPVPGTLIGPTTAWVVETWRVRARLRRDVYRRWLFVELEPELDFVRPPGGGRNRTRSVVLRLEVQFDASTRRPGPRRPPASGLPASPLDAGRPWSPPPLVEPQPAVPAAPLAPADQPPVIPAPADPPPIEPPPAAAPPHGASGG